ncbi:MAG: putative glycosyltransferase [Candidatus Falkowbacteria bacterium GW2011_GWC2_38_22]|uniref:Putative glycosyltransferase n=1 Tax=Candidatus Falkowbacteria bacterium GW2011_GWE1_38_31 TaxID=1618638 RepID=A0A0G0MAC9_9BACT|nr:MAG: putative glycosyltransferase [Candidatus Falkowbacteria bacterium GW2011_GWF2_38_1205]KKQ62004.1 MAG: putative glycosyltransferase [Candidatus Falkowbacteria bacterium GW2011_GWC2_38_22]KKQ63834.1 MAG: putative glycosyltransferase [Candidatus Falkowbacteria bacterium GW2011_GWF1_38_22]KKQ66091.1 MAG: putative glycosyltransferase [Candidatus Falkowbacteria bacterium GW2011_GWE2_38_254]KKQ70694.1 MAG: putative glycosyltransferase [Candidatus Falkowbacteria bacterium GW2011_GWE1_38_31]KKQ
MKICQINNLFKPYSRGGADRIVEIIYNGLKKEGHDVFVVSTQTSKKNYQENGNYYLKSYYARLAGMLGVFRAFFVLADLVCLKNYFRIKKIIKNEKVDLVITHNLRGLGFWTVRALKNIKHIHILHDIQLIHPSGLMIQNEEEKINNVFAKLYFNITKKILASPNFAISPSAWLLEEHIARGFFKKSKKIVLPNPAEISESTKSHDRADGQIKFLYVGEIEKHKGIFLLIEAFLQCRKYYENISLDVIGKGSGEADLPRIQGINYLGWKTKKEVASAMVSADCLIVPSLCYENSPTVIYEAANSCLPVIASRIGGIGELAHQFGGILFNPGEIQDLEKKMVYAIKNPQIIKIIGEVSGEKIKKYSVENYLKKIIELAHS